MNAQDRVEMSIGALRIHGSTGSLELRSKDGEWSVPLRLNRATARALEREFEGKGGTESSVRDILAGTIANLNAKLKCARISAAPRGRIAAEVVFEHGGEEAAMPARPGDAVALARRLGAPVYAGRDVLERDGMSTKEGAVDIAKAGANEMARLIWGFRAMGRIDEAIQATKRFLELVPQNESWHEALGEFYRERGWLKKAAEEMARGMMWYMRQGYITHAVNTAKEIGALDLESLGPKTITAPAVLEDFESPKFNNEWLAGGEVVNAPKGGKGKCYRESFDFAGDSSPWFILSMLGTRTWHGAKALVADVHLNLTAGKPGSPVLECALDLSGMGEKDWVKGPPAELKPGWNRCVFPLDKKIWSRGDEKLVPGGESIGPVINVVLIPAGLDDNAAGEVCFSNIRLEA